MTSRFKPHMDMWDRVYTCNPSTQLPWYTVKVHPTVLEFVKSIGAESVWLTGAGTGETANEVWQAGVKNVCASDISTAAVGTAKARFPHLKFECIATQELAKRQVQADVVLDWLVLHHIAPEELAEYVTSLEKIADHIVIAHLSEVGAHSKHSYVTSGLTHNHSEVEVNSVISETFGMHKTVEDWIDTNAAYPGGARRHRMLIHFIRRHG